MPIIKAVILLNEYYSIWNKQVFRKDRMEYCLAISLVVIFIK